MTVVDHTVDRNFAVAADRMTVVDHSVDRNFAVATDHMTVVSVCADQNFDDHCMSIVENGSSFVISVASDNRGLNDQSYHNCNSVVGDADDERMAERAVRIYAVQHGHQ